MEVIEKKEDKNYKYEVKLKNDGFIHYKCDEPIRGKTVIHEGKEKERTTEQILDDIFQKVLNSPGKKENEENKVIIKGDGKFNIYGYNINYNKKIVLWESEK